MFFVGDSGIPIKHFTCCWHCGRGFRSQHIEMFSRSWRPISHPRIVDLQSFMAAQQLRFLSQLAWWWWWGDGRTLGSQALEKLLGIEVWMWLCLSMLAHLDIEMPNMYAVKNQEQVHKDCTSYIQDVFVLCVLLWLRSCQDSPLSLHCGGSNNWSCRLRLPKAASKCCRGHWEGQGDWWHLQGWLRCRSKWSQARWCLCKLYQSI